MVPWTQIVNEAINALRIAVLRDPKPFIESCRKTMEIAQARGNHVLAAKMQHLIDEASKKL